MIRVNLLPHRAEKRKRRQTQFAALSAVSLLAGIVLVGVGHFILAERIAYQERRNNYLNQEIAKLDRQIEEIRKLREETRALLARKDEVEKLQDTRSDVVHLLDQVLRILPDGVYLKSLRQTKEKISVIGLAQSNARVSTLMHKIESSDWLNSPTLVEVQSTNDRGQRLNQFTLNFNLTRHTARAPGGAASGVAASGVAAPGGANSGLKK